MHRRRGRERAWRRETDQFFPGRNCGSFIVRLLITPDTSGPYAIVNNIREAGLSCRDHYLSRSITFRAWLPRSRLFRKPIEERVQEALNYDTDEKKPDENRLRTFDQSDGRARSNYLRNEYLHVHMFT